LLRAAAAAGWSVVAVDRPGYGRSATCAEDVAPAARRVPLTFGAVDRLLAGRDRGAGLFVLGHSIGCELAVRLAAGRDDVLGLAIAGTGRVQQERAGELLAPAGGDVRDLPRPAVLHELLWEPARLYPPDVDGAAIGARSPRYEGAVVADWTVRGFAELAARVRVPVHYALGEHERVWRNDPDALADVAGLFTASPRVVVDTPADAGHNLSVGLSAPDYHRAVLEFAEGCRR
jgi:pimeloyl-ACP methyl ester carboxylesterase